MLIPIIILLKKVNMILVISLGGFSEEAEIPGIQYVLSPYKLNLVATPLFLKPGIPYSVKVDGGGKTDEYDCLFLFTENMGGGKQRKDAEEASHGGNSLCETCPSRGCGQGWETAGQLQPQERFRPKCQYLVR